MPTTTTTDRLRRTNVPWTEAMVERLTKLWTENGRTIGEIATDLSKDTGRTLTRNAVTGKIDRLGLTGKGAMPGKGGRRRRECATAAQRKPTVSVMPVVRVEPEPTPEPEPTQPVQPSPGTLHPSGRWPIVDLRSTGQCKFPCGEEGGRHLFCGEVAPIGPGNPHGSWCPAHRSRVFEERANLGRPAYLRRQAMVR